MYEIHGLFDPVAGAILRSQILRLAKTLGAQDEKDMASGDRSAVKRTFPQLMADALSELTTGTGSSKTGSDSKNGRRSGVSVVVTVTLEELLGKLDGVGYIAGNEIPAGEIRRMATDHGVIPAVMGGPSQVLDLGRTRRFATSQMPAPALASNKRRLQTCGAVLHPGDVAQQETGGDTAAHHHPATCQTRGNNTHHNIHDHDWQVKRQPNGTHKTIPPP